MSAFGRRFASLLVLFALVASFAMPAAHAAVHARNGQIHSARSHAEGLTRPDAADDIGCSLVKAPLSPCTISRVQSHRTPPPRPTLVVSLPDRTPDQHGVDFVAPTRGPPSQSA